MVETLKLLLSTHFKWQFKEQAAKSGLTTIIVWCREQNEIENFVRLATMAGCRCQILTTSDQNTDWTLSYFDMLEMLYITAMGR